MRKLDATLIFAIAVAIAASSPASAKVAKSSSSGKLFEHSATGQHFKQGQITAKKTNGQTRPISLLRKQQTSRQPSKDRRSET